MKKISILLAVVLLFCSFVIPVSAEEEKYTAVVSTKGVFTYKDNEENIISSHVTLSNAEDFTHGEIIYRYNPSVIRGAPERIESPGIYYETRFTQKYVQESDCTIISFEKDEDAPSNYNVYSGRLPLEILSVGEHNLSIEVVVYNEKEEKTVYNVVYQFDLYSKVVEQSEVMTVDKGELELKYGYYYLYSKTKVSEILAEFGEAQVCLVDINLNALDNDAIIPNGTYIATMYNGCIADKIQICVMEDVNCDAKITAADARLALRYSAKLELISNVQQFAADMTDDLRVTAADARLILRKAAGLE